MAKINGFVFWEGVSQIDGVTPVVAIVTGLNQSSANSKTGAMVQTWILRADMSPTEAVSNRADVGICGGCVHRKQENGKRTCYVNVGYAPLAIFNAYKRGSYGTLSTSVGASLLAGKNVRLGAYGDPAAIPVDVWEKLIVHTAGHTGYTHQWRKASNTRFAALCQASCETWGDVERATAKGFGSFYVVPVGQSIPKGTVNCPASKEQGYKLTCADCMLCDGASRSIVTILAHGAQRNSYNPRVLPTL